MCESTGVFVGLMAASCLELAQIARSAATTAYAVMQVMDDRVAGGVDDLLAHVRDLTGRHRWRDARGLAWKLGLELRRRARDGAALDGRIIEYDRAADARQAQHLIAHAIAQWLLLEWEVRDSECLVRHVAAELVELGDDSQSITDGERSLPLATLA